MKNTLLAFISSILLYSCASQLPPTGGPKDKDPPQLIFSDPENNTLNWNGKVIQLTFNENIQANEFKKELLITPTYNGDYEYKLNRGTVEITFEEPFNDSTTYTLNFREAIVDLNESNPAEKLLIAFSTWNFLDSIEMSGNVKYLLLDEPSPDFTVGLYNASDTLNPLNSSPVYLTKTNKLGNYSFHHLKSDDYRVYAFFDKNNNLRIDSKKEAYGFLPDPITLDTTKREVDLEVVNLDLTELEISSNRQSGQYYEIKFPKFINRYELALLDTNMEIEIFHKIQDNNKMVKIYNTLNEFDSIAIKLSYSDSLLNTKTDTLYIGFRTSPRKGDDFTTTSESSYKNGIIQSTISLSKPLKFIDMDSIYIEWDSLAISYFDSTNIVYSDNYFQISLHKDFSVDSIFNLEPNIIPTIYFNKSAFISIESDTSKKFSQKILEKDKSKFGSISGLVNLPYERYILQLIDKDNNVLFSRKDVKSYIFTNIKAGKYRIRIVVDNNGNGEWDGGSILEFIEPEPILFYKSTNNDQVITLRANWELVDIDIDLRELMLINHE